MCLGFDVEEPARVITINYVDERVPIEFPFPADDLRKIVDQLLNTKYIEWKYEQEKRIWMRFTDCERADRFYFCNFDKTIQLKEVIAGPLCKVTEQEIRAALGDMHDVAVRAAQLAFKTFHVTEIGFGFRRNE